MQSKSIFFLVLLLTFFPLVSSAKNSVANQQQYSVKLKNFLEHRLQDDSKEYDPLLEIVSINIPLEQKTILDGMKFILIGTSYDINSSVTINENTSKLVSKQLPNIQRNLTNVTRLEALKFLIGKHHNVLIDPVLRQIGFDLRSELKEKVL